MREGMSPGFIDLGIPEKELTGGVPEETSLPSEKLAPDLKLADNHLSAIASIKQEEGIVLEEKKLIAPEMENKNPEIKRIELNNRIRQELGKIPEDTKETPEMIAERIIECLCILPEEEMERETIYLKVEVHLHILRDSERFASYNKTEKEKRTRELAIKDAKWMQKIGDRIRSIRENKDIPAENKEKKINGIWREVKEVYNNHAEFYRKLNTEYSEYNIGGDGFEGAKRGILGQVAAEELFGLANKYLKKFDAGEIVVLPATAEEDVDKKTDFFIKVKYKNGVERIIPCQIKAPEFKESTQDSIKASIVDVVLKTKNYEDIGGKDPDYKKKRISKFRKYALEKYGIGYYITIPDGEAWEIISGKKPGKKKKKVIDLLEDDGSVADDTKKRFFMEIGSALGIDILRDSAIIDKLNLLEREENKKGGKSK